MWKKIKGYENYVVNEYGDVVNTDTGRTLKHAVNEYGYHWITLSRNGEVARFRIHRLVLMAFAPIDNPEKWQVNHKDEDKSNNHISNLEWCNAHYNLNYGTRMDRIRKKINQYDKDLNFIKTYESGTAAAAETGINRGDISSAANGKRIRTAGGYRWRYVKDTVDGIEPVDKSY